MNIMKRKRSHTDMEDVQIKNKNKLAKIISEIVDNEKNILEEELREQYIKNHQDLLNENNDLIKLNKSLEYKSKCFEEMYQKTVENRDIEFSVLYKKIDFLYCVSCDDCTETKIHCPNGHSNCKECVEVGLQSYITYQTISTKYPKCLKCQSLLDEKIVSDIVNGDLWGKFISERTRMDISETKHSVAEMCSPHENYSIKRPCCGRPMIDFEGCAALSCEYCEKSFYCAFCMETFDDNEECHKHVSSCKYNTQPTYHIISECQIISLKQCWNNILMEQLSESLNFDLPNPVYTSNT